MSIPAQIAAVIAGIIVSAQAKVTMHVLGQPVTIPVLWLVMAALVLTVAAIVLVLLRLLVRDGLCLRPGTVTS